MTIKEAAEIVLQAATAQANGSANAAEILEAAEFVRSYIADQDE